MPNRAFYAGPAPNCDYHDAELWRLERPQSFYGQPAAEYVVTGTVPPWPEVTGTPGRRNAIDQCTAHGVRIGFGRPECPGLHADRPFEQLFAFFHIVPVRRPHQLEFSFDD